MDEGVAGKPVWARKGVGLYECPKTAIRAESLRWLEEFFTRRKLGGWRVEELGAREADAFVLLEELVSKEKDDG